MAETTNHARCALMMPAPYKGAVQSSHDRSDKWTIIEAATYYDLPPLLDREGIWAICIDGLYCLTTSYPIAGSRLGTEDWPAHMEEKDWVDGPEFLAAYQRACSLRDLGYIR